MNLNLIKLDQVEALTGFKSHTSTPASVRRFPKPCSYWLQRSLGRVRSAGLGGEHDRTSSQSGGCVKKTNQVSQRLKDTNRVLFQTVGRKPRDHFQAI